ncbi:alanine/glycine:cation symporter family protein [Aquimarina litoralis]|uniref:alanine/glycine:cation symporter family protein n=1 Tax=Aquimarina litoralis TaxID=584605 RepID=UPI001C5A0F46|nr:alanine/glycine:cation symporter family protein [Aquimarina litoralis]MBW1295623.1 amino acid carrier protein [Aquimarina litoralis]
MKKIILLCVSFLLNTQVKSQELGIQSFDERINDRFKSITDWFVDAILAEIPITTDVGIPWVLVVLLLGASYFTIYFKGINFRNFWTSINIIRGKYDHLENSGIIEVSNSVHTINNDQPDTIRVEGEIGEVSHFQALTAALSATVGLGNIAGVAIALSIGGAGATFWMILVGFLGMASKFVECTLGVAYREIDEKGTVYGGPMYYLSKGLRERGFSNLGKALAAIFAIMCVGGSFGGGNMFQANQAFKLFEYVTGAENSFIYGKGWLFGLIMAILVGIVIIGGIKKIAKVTDKIVPAMVVVYVLAVITIITINYEMIPNAFSAIIDGAFSAEGVTGGIIGVMIQGFRRAAFSNEAGIGSASIAHSAVKTKYAASEGLVALLEPFIDTVVICTMTALVLIITGQIDVGTAISDEQGVLLTANALESGISWFPYLLSFAVILFAFSSMISWSYYGYQAWSYLFGRKKYVEYIYKSMFCICVIIGSAASLTAVIDFSDAMIFSMLVPNMIGLFIMAPRVSKELKKYKDAIKKFEKI